MNGTARLVFGATAALILSLTSAAPGFAVDATIYEATENMSLQDAAGAPVFALSGAAFRIATSALQGSANLGTPWCPTELLVTNPTAGPCAVTASGADRISLETGKGWFNGTYAVVVQGDNPVDAPEFVVQYGIFEGEMDFSSVILDSIPIGTIVGTATISAGLGAVGTTYGLSGTFRLPFAVDSAGKRAKARKAEDAFYLGDDGSLMRVRADEFSVGFPAVRLEITLRP